MENKILVGIDPGVNTGVAVMSDGKLSTVMTCGIIEAMAHIKNITCQGSSIKIYIEDARQRKWFGASGREVLQGVGSVKRDCGIWEEFCLHHNLDFKLIAPKYNHTKTTTQEFKRITGWDKRTSTHSRDAVMLIWGLRNVA